MSTTAIASSASTASSQYAQWVAFLQSQQQADTSAMGATASASGDAAMISAQGMALLQSGGGGAEDSNTAAGAASGASASDGAQGDWLATVTSTLQQQDPTLYSALDTDGDGQVSADELKAGRAALTSAVQQATRSVGAGDVSGGDDPSTQFLAALDSALKQSAPDLAKAMEGSDGSISTQSFQQAAKGLHLHHHHHGQGGSAGAAAGAAAGNSTGADSASASTTSSTSTVQQQALAALLATLQPSTAGPTGV